MKINWLNHLLTQLLISPSQISKLYLCCHIYVIYLIRQNELELANTDFKILPNKADFFVSLLFCNPSTAHTFGTNWPISMRSVVKSSFGNDVHNQLQKWKLNLTNFRLILFDHIKYIIMNHVPVKRCLFVKFYTQHPPFFYFSLKHPMNPLFINLQQMTLFHPALDT